MGCCFFQIQAHIYIHTQAHSLQKVYKNVFDYFCIVPDMHQSIWGYTVSEKMDKHDKIKSTLHIFIETYFVMKLIVQKSLLVNTNLHFYIPSHDQHEKELPQRVKS